MTWPLWQLDIKMSTGFPVDNSLKIVLLSQSCFDRWLDKIICCRLCDVCSVSCGTRLTELASDQWRWSGVSGVTKGGQWSQSRHCCTHTGHHHCCTKPLHQAVVTNITIRYQLWVPSQINRHGTLPYFYHCTVVNNNVKIALWVNFQNIKKCHNVQQWLCASCMEC